MRYNSKVEDGSGGAPSRFLGASCFVKVFPSTPVRGGSDGAVCRQGARCAATVISCHQRAQLATLATSAHRPLPSASENFCRLLPAPALLCKRSTCSAWAPSPTASLAPSPSPLSPSTLVCRPACAYRQLPVRCTCTCSRVRLAGVSLALISPVTLESSSCGLVCVHIAPTLWGQREHADVQDACSSISILSFRCAYSFSAASMELFV